MEDSITEKQAKRLNCSMLHKTSDPHYTHPSSVVVCNTDDQLQDVFRAAETLGIRLGSVSSLRPKYEFPLCISVNGDLLGWTNLMDRALYYIPYETFKSQL